jgi:hypothetical protein
MPGKGENSWDVGDDAIYGGSCPAASCDAVVAHILASVYDRREKYGLPDSLKEKETGK